MKSFPVLALCVFALSMVSSTGCKRTETPAREPDVQRCREGLVGGLRTVETVHPARRLLPALGALEGACGDVLGALATSAREASSQGMPRRAHVLAAGAEALLPPTCVAAEPEGPALEVSYACPPPDAFALAEPLLKDLDAGTYVFALAARERLARVGALDADTERLLSNLVLAGALEGEARRLAGRGTP